MIGKPEQGIATEAQRHRVVSFIPLQPLCTLCLCGLLLGCGGPLEPAQLTPDQDICSHCRMTIVQPELAAQAVEPGSVGFFDDIGCLAAWLRQQPAGGEMALFVADFESAEWLKAEDAFYVQSPSMPTPMHSGLTAFKTADRAQAAAGRLQGRLLSWDEALMEAEP